MIGSLRGTLLDRTGDEVLVEVGGPGGGTGYRVLVAPATSLALGAVGDVVRVHVHHHVREDAQTLYGFLTAEDRRTFEVLLTAHGVGPSLALAVLTALPPAELRRALAANDVDALCAVPGVGKKTAARLVLDLSSKLVSDADPADPVPAGAAPPPAAQADVREALMGMGFGAEEVRRVMADLPDADDAGELLRVALQRLAAA
ncbi:MAG: Holliday junction branch migration protein RuvA [Actinomycetes bacterium]